MTDVLSIALSGLVDQGRRLSASASNITNSGVAGRVPTKENPNSTVYKPLEVKTNSVALNGQPGGVKTEVTVKDTYSLAYSPKDFYANEEGMIAVPDVDYAEESVKMLTAKIAYKANLAVIKTEKEMLGELLDSIS